MPASAPISSRYASKKVKTCSGSAVIGQMKRWVSKQIRAPIWQKSFYDHIIRDDEDYENIWQYIDMNPFRVEELPSGDKSPG